MYVPKLQQIMYMYTWLKKEMKCHPVCPFSITRIRVDDETLGSALYSGGELVDATHGRRQIFKIAFQFVAEGAF